jgi:hypothetical protein
VKLLCKGNHWEIKGGQLLLDTPQERDTETAKKMISVLEAQIRLKIYEEICDLKITDNRRQIVKNGIDNALLAVQAICADTALGDKK